MYRFDISKIYPELYSAKKDRVKLISVPAMRVLSINGEGDFEGPRFKDSLAALNSVAYALKSIKKDDIIDDDLLNFHIPALEVLWSMKSGGRYDATQDDQLLWEIILVVPGVVTQKLVNMAIADVSLHNENSRIKDVHINELQEKKCIQTLHEGSYSTIHKSVTRLDAYIARKGFKASSRYHEIFIGEFASFPPKRVKVILRQPVVRLG